MTAEVTDAELVTLIAQVFMDLPRDRQFLARAAYRPLEAVPDSEWVWIEGAP